MDRRYREDGDETPWGAVADGWLAALLPEIFRADVLLALADRFEIRGDARTLFLELTDDLSRGDRERLRDALAR